jgi:hypothetical protein
MPKFVRLYNNEDNVSSIRNSFKDQLILEPNTKVSLLDINASFSQGLGDDFKTNGLGLSYDIGATTYDVNFTQNYSDLKSFVTGVQNELNFQNTGNVDYLDWDTTVSSDNKLTLSLKTLTPQDADFDTEGSVTGTWTTRNATDIRTGSTQDARYLSNNPLPRLSFRIEADARVSAKLNEFRLGFINVEGNINDIDTFIGLKYDGGAGKTYRFYVNNTEIQDTGIAVTTGSLTNDNIVMEYGDSGKLTITITPPAGAPNIVTYDIGNTTKGNQYSLLADVKSAAGASSNVGFLNASVTEVRPNNTIAATATLNLSSEILRGYLGFTNSSITEHAIAGQSIDYVADKRIFGDNNISGAIVTLEGVGQIKSSDGQSGQNMPIIGIIPETAIIGSTEVVHSTSFKYRLELENSTPISVRNLTVRLYRNLDEPPLNLGSGSVVSILFE